MNLAFNQSVAQRYSSNSKKIESVNGNVAW